MDKKQQIIAALYAFINQRPGLEFCNYGDVTAYRSEQRSIARDKRDALELLRSVELRDSITADDIVDAAKSAYSGRLSIDLRADGSVAVDYCAGQYFPTEYRKAVAAVCASALWHRAADDMPEGTLMHNSETGETLRRYEGLRAGDYLRRNFKRQYGRRIQNAWFS